MPRLSPFMLMGGNSHPQLLKDVAFHLDRTPTPVKVSKFANEETSVSLLKSVRDADVFIIQTGTGHIASEEENFVTSLNDSCMELFVLASGVKLASAHRVVSVLPYFPYSKQSKQKRRGTIVSRLIADLLQTAGVEHVITLDLHHMQMQGFFGIPIDNVKSSPLLIDYIREHISDFRDYVVVSKNAGALKRAALIAKRLQLQLAMISGEQYKYAEALSEERLGGEGSLDAEEQGNLVEIEDEAQGDGIIGSVTGRNVLVIDDIVDTSASFVSAARLLKANGAGDIYVIGTHGLLSGNAPEEFNECNDICKIIVTNTIPQQDHKHRCPKLEVIDCSFVLAEAIRRVHNNEPLYSMYTNHGVAESSLHFALTQWNNPRRNSSSAAASVTGSQNGSRITTPLSRGTGGRCSGPTKYASIPSVPSSSESRCPCSSAVKPVVIVGSSSIADNNDKDIINEEMPTNDNVDHPEID